MHSSFYRPSAYALAQTVVDVPLVFIQIVIFNIIVYLYAGPSSGVLTRQLILTSRKHVEFVKNAIAVFH